MIYDGNFFVGSALNGDSLMHRNDGDGAYWMTRFDHSGDSLSHHGVPNQKWGVRNGPPYPVKRGSEKHYNVGKMTTKTRERLEKNGTIAKAGAKVKSSFRKWKEAKKEDLAVKDAKSTLVKNWQKKQLRISDMTNEELQQRIDRRKLEEMYRHALRNDFTDPKTWNSGKGGNGGNNGNNGKKVAESILRIFGNAAVEGLAAGIQSKVSYSVTARSKGKVDRRQKRASARNDIAIDAMKERAERKAREQQDRHDHFADERQDRIVDSNVRADYVRRLTSGNDDMDELWRRYGPSI